MNIYIPENLISSEIFIFVPLRKFDSIYIRMRTVYRLSAEVFADNIDFFSKIDRAVDFQVEAKWSETLSENVLLLCFTYFFGVVLFSLCFRFPPLKRKWKNLSEKEKQILGSEKPLYLPNVNFLQNIVYRSCIALFYRKRLPQQQRDR